MRTGCFSKDSRIKSRSAAISLTGRLGFHSRRPSKPPSRNVEDDRGEPPGSTALAARRARYPRPEQMARKMLRIVEIRGVHAAGNGPSSDRKCWQRLELGIHGLNRWTVKCLEMSKNAEFKQTKRPERGQMCWQRLERNRSPSPTPAGGPVAKLEITEAEWATHSLGPGNVVGPQRPIIMWHSPPATRYTRLRVRRLGIGSAWHALHATKCYVFRLFRDFGKLGFRCKFLLNRWLWLVISRPSFDDN